MKTITIAMALLLQSFSTVAATFYGEGLCAYPQYECVKIDRGQSWETLFPDEVQRDIVQRINRSYNNLWLGKTIAVPRKLANKTLLDFAPFPLQIEEKGNKQVIV